MQFDEYSDQTVFITGAASGIGQAQAIAFLESGANVIGYDIDKDGLNNLLVKYPHHFYYVVGSVSDPKSINKAIKDTISQYKKDRKSTRLNSSHVAISYAVFCL